MAITHAAYGAFMQNLFTGVHNVTSDTNNVVLVASGYTPNLDSHAYLSDVTNEITGTGYTAGGKRITITGVTYASGIVSVNASSVDWTTLTGTFRYAVIYQVKSSAATSNLMGLIDFGADRTYNAAPFTLSMPNGLLVLGRSS